MPMTLKRNVDGRVVPFKLSILEALQPSPPPHKKKSTGSKPSSAPSHARSTPKLTKIGVAMNSDGHGVITKLGNDEAHTFTAADDAKLIEMKAADKTWKEIVAETHKSQSALKERFKEIRNAADDGTGNGNGERGEAQCQAKVGDDKKETVKRSEAASAIKNPEEAKGKKGKSASGASGSNTKKATSQASTSTNYDGKRLAEFAAKYERDKWRFAASKYYDLTGIRISEEEVKRRAEGLK